MKGKPLTIAMLGLTPKGSSSSAEASKSPDESESSDEAEKDKDLEELPLGFEEAITEFREAEDDKSAAEALFRALRCADLC